MIQKVSSEMIALSNQSTKERDYWLNKLSGELVITSFPYDQPMIHAHNETPKDSLQFSLKGELFNKLIKLSNGYDYTLHMLLMAGLVALLERNTGNQDIIVGTPIYKQEIEGEFLNTVLALRNQLDEKMTFKELLLQVRQNIMEATENQNYPIETLVYKLHITNANDDRFLFDTAVLLENIHDIRYIEHIKLNSIFLFQRKEDIIEGTLEYNPVVYTKKTMERIIEQYIRVLTTVLSDVNLPVSQIELLAEDEKQKLLVDFNRTEVEHSGKQTIYELFEEQVEKNPDAIAVNYENQSITYCELNRKANQLARTLRSAGVEADQIVGICIERSIEMILGMLAIIKAGGAYLPLDPSYPEDRISYMIKDSDMKVLLVDVDIEEEGVKTINVKNPDIYTVDDTNLQPINAANNLAYIIYTSGSTGTPKGVMIEHKSIANTLQWRRKYYQFDEHDVVLQIPSFSFDSSVEDIFTPLISGAKLVVVHQQNRFNLNYLKDVIKTQSVTHFLIVPNFYRVMLNEIPEYLKNVRIITVAGDHFTEELVKEHFEKLPTVRFCNEYGPTENSVCSTVYEFTSTQTKIVIGQPIDNVKCYILDRNGKPCATGAAGELCVSGKGLARGYYKRPELTCEKFVENPFISGERMYKTGDMARWLDDGNIDFIGRMDQQVKIRGFRVELGEIENRILQHKKVKEAIVVALDNENKDKFLTGYIVLADLAEDETAGASELRGYLYNDLPEYMVPQYFVFMDQLPLLPNGKIDKKALPIPEASAEVEYVAPRNDIEKKLVEIWAEVLGVEEKQIGIDHNFFDLGGHSLKATGFVTKVFKKLNVEIPIRQVFNTPTIRELTECIQEMGESKYLAIEPVEERESYPVSSAQKRLFVLSQLEAVKTSYNVPGAMIIEGDLDVQRLENAFTAFIQRHEVLRTSFAFVNEEPIQKIHQDVEFKIDYIDVSAKEENIETLVKGLVQPFDLSKAPLLRVKLIKLSSNQRYLLFFDMHHIIADGVSMSILVREITQLYEGKELPALRVQYKDYAVWQNDLFTTGMKAEEEYWLNEFAGEIPVLHLPTDYPRPTVMSFEGNNIHFTVDESITRKLKELAKQEDATLYMVLLATYNVLLSKYSGQEDIIVGSPIAGRPHADLENIMGMFVNTLAIRNHPASDKSFTQLLNEVTEKTLKAYENQDYPFEMIVEQLNLERDMSRNPLFNVMFVLQNMAEANLQMNNLKFTPYQLENKTAKFDMTLVGAESNNEIHFTLEYSTKLYKKTTIERMVKHFVHILEAVVFDPQIKLFEIEMFAEDEKDMILNRFNQTTVDYSVSKTIQQLFEAKVDELPNQSALVYQGQHLTYQQLNEKANQLARTLRAKGVGPDQVVGIMAEHSFETIIGVLAIVKAGGAYLPINSEYPINRIEFMLEDTKAKLLLMQENLMKEIHFAGETIDLIDPKMYATDSSNIDNLNSPTDLIYVIYTSGSTGTPKGVLIQHKNVNRLLSNSNLLKVTDKDRLLQTGSLAFDASTYEIWGTLLNGATLYLINKEELLSTDSFTKQLKMNQISWLFITTALFNKFAEEDPTIFAELNTLLVGGETLSTKYINKVKQTCPKVNLYNIYGPTESTTFATFFKIEQEYEANIPIGKPLSNTSVYILDHKNKLQPLGIAGELCIGGDGLARGYLNRFELTAEKFTINPYEPEQKIYHTGDLARWLPDGNIEFLGRIDHQVKIRGFRIEPEEIEAELLNHPDIKESIVIDGTDEFGEKYLAAYYVAPREITVSELRTYLLQNMPEYMVPSYFIQLETMPLNENGKISRSELPVPELNLCTGKEFEAPTTEIEAKLVKIWSDILNIKEIGINDNFFEIGGHSLRATTLAAKTLKEFNVAIPLAQIFKTPTIKALAEYIETQETSIYASIEPVEEQEYYPVSSAQKRLFILNQLDSANTSYNIASAMIIEGDLNVERLEYAFKQFIQRHESLRTSFALVEGKPVQIIHPTVDFNMDYITADSADIDVTALVNGFVRPFDLSKAPLLRVQLIQLPVASAKSKRHLFIFDMHHIISDGISMSLLIKEIIDLYQEKELPALRIQYKDFAAWQNDFFGTDKFRAQEEYWLQEFAGEVPVLNIPTDYSRSAEMNYAGARIKFIIEEELTKKITELTKQTGTTSYMVLLAAFNVLLSKYAGQEDITVGSPIAGRPHLDLENIVGMFVNTLAIRNYPINDKTFKEFLADVKTRTVNAFDNQDYPLEKLVDKLNIERTQSRNPLFDVLFVLQNMEMNPVQLNELKFSPYPLEGKTATFDLVLTAVEGATRIPCILEYKTGLFKEETAQRLAKYFVKILEHVVANADVKIYDIKMTDEEEKTIIGLNETKVQYSEKQTLGELFEEQAEKTPGRIAVKFNDQSIKYRDLNKKANQLARVLRSAGVKTDEIVGIRVERSIEMIIGMLAIIKAGGAYLPLDPSYPTERISYMIKDSDMRIMLVDSPIDGDMIDGVKTINIKAEEIYSSNEDTNLEPLSKANNLAYIIYTSGSTGNPKGVMIEHQSIINTLLWRKNFYQFNERDVVLQIPSFSFDSSVEDIFTPLLSGAKVIMIQQEKRLDLNYLQEIIEANNVTHFLVVPNLYHVMLKEIAESLEDVRVITVAGDNFTEELVKEHFEKLENVRLCNEYGPTENSVCSTVYEFNPSKTKVIIGKPIDNVSCYIIDQYGKPVSIGAVGELCVAGKGLARGYYKRPELTNEKFVPNPFVSGERMYKTGDLARWLENGNIEFLGRIDHQVKIRGFRVELGEIENKLLHHEKVDEAVVVALDDKKKNKFLATYIVSKQLLSNESISAAELKSYLSQELPEYMVPQYFIFLDKMPLLPNGKINKQALVIPEVKAEVEYIAPRGEVEAKLVEMWSEVLGVDQELIGIDHNFFELGGHSLKATELVSKVFKNLNVELTIRQIFKTPTIRQLAECIQGSEESIYASIEPVEEKDYYPVSSAQKRVYIVNQLKLAKTTYNTPGAMIIEGDLNVTRLETAFKTLLQRHESLRTSFEVIEGEPVQRIHPEVDFAMTYMVADAEELDTSSMVKEFVKPFELSQAPLLRAGLIKLPVNQETGKIRHIFLFDMHHIISDGVSMSIFVNEIISLYKGEVLPNLRIQYKDFAVWQNEFFKSEKFKEQEAYWLNEFVNEVPILDLPTDYPRPAVMTFEGDRLAFVVEEELTQKLYNLAQANDATLYMVLLAAYNILLSKYSNQEDIIVGTPSAGRPHADLENIMGMFVNTLAMRNYPVSDQSFTTFLADVTERALKAYENQTYQFEMLIEKLALDWDISRNPLFTVMFALQNMGNFHVQLEGLTFSAYPIENKNAKFDLTLTAIEGNNKLYFNLEYNTKLFKHTTIERMAKHFTTILNTVTSHPEWALAQVQMITNEEQQQLLDFNHTQVTFEDKKVHQLFEAQVEKTPEQVVLVFGNEQLTYRKLNEKANQVGRELRERGVGRDTIVAVMLDNSFVMIISILGILKAGGAYLPIDPAYPENRINYIFNDSKAKLLLTKKELIANIEFAGEWIDLEDQRIWQHEVSNLLNINEANDLAYVIYTSGSTGQPKGVMIEHRGFTNTITWRKEVYGFSIDDVSLQLFSYAFDGFVITFFTPIVSGAKVILLTADKVRDPFAIKNHLISEKVTYFMCVPTLYAAILDCIKGEKISTVKCVTLGADQVTQALIEKSQQILMDTELINEYGPTENSVVTTMQRMLQKESTVTIGQPVANNQVFIVDKNLQLVPIGVPGEICISSVGLARGYLHNPKLTEEKFIINPFNPQARLYKTGDKARWTEEGKLEFLGRIDQQVKIRGFRIELGEIENQLLHIEAIKEAVVVARVLPDGEDHLCAYFVADSEVTVADIKTKLKAKLPDYMVPNYYIQLEKMPLNVNGKINRKALPDFTEEAMQKEEYVAPTDEIEEKLIQIWSDVLKIKQIGINDNFFNIGGNSVTAIKVFSKVRENGWELTAQDFFEYPTVKEQANKIRQGECNVVEIIANENEFEKVPQIHTSTSNLQHISVNKVLLTGATGYLGTHLLVELLENTTSDIYCLVRGKDKIEAEKRLKGLLQFYFSHEFTEYQERIIVVSGDVANERFGLDQADFAYLVEEIDCIIHSAAMVKHFGYYENLRQINVIGTKHVLDFARKSGARLNYISTMSISGSFVHDKDGAIFTEEDFYIGQNYTANIYLKSKFEAENLVLRELNQGLAGTIFRMGNLTGRYSDGKFQKNIGENVFYGLLKLLLDFRMIPKDSLTTQYELAPVDLCSQAIVKVIETKEAVGRIFHIYNDKFISVAEIVKAFCDLGVPINVLSPEEVEPYIAAAKEDEEKRDTFEKVLPYLTPTHPEQKRNVRINTQLTKDYLRKVNFEWSPITTEYLGKILDYMKQTGFIKN